jgi:hypothetical protein
MNVGQAITAAMQEQRRKDWITLRWSSWSLPGMERGHLVFGQWLHLGWPIVPGGSLRRIVDL